ncbi:MAG: alkylation response protein AidB-like acyl-CoA dehydrogenase [Myxococcota bacterium]|jgi:alkylation response protein AidB-like acyl-CoA dehydrogenase
MSHYKTPIDEIRFNLEAFGYSETVHSIPDFADFDLDTAMGIISEFAKFCEGELLPLNAKGDQDGLVFDPKDHSVTTPAGFKEAWAAFSAAGWTGVTGAVEYGGFGAPHAVGVMTAESLIATNKSFSMCDGLSKGLINALSAGEVDDALKQAYLPNLISGKWTGTMCLTEAQCGTDLGLMSTKATPNDDGSFDLTGSKIWISFGEHDYSENIIHLVLARLPDAPAGIKGISAFIVPKFLEDGSRNPVFCGSLEHKMGINASPTCVINMEAAKGWLVGQPHKGMRTMFVMMNTARLHTGLEGVALGEYAYQAALAFAKDRRQSRSLDKTKREKGVAADNILVHPDVRRMLLNIKSTTVPLRGLACWIASQIDVAEHHPDKETREKAGGLVALLTPVIKSYGSERGFQNTSEAMQVMGGAGFTRDWPVEQLMRDLRIAMLYEGTNHIQALDLVGRKLPMNGGALIMSFAGEVREGIKAAAADPAIAPFASILAEQSKQLSTLTQGLMMSAMQDREVIGAVASSYLNFFALVTLGHVWLRQLAHAKTFGEDSPVWRGKLQTARFFFESVLPEADVFAARVKAGKGSVTDIDISLL